MKGVHVLYDIDMLCEKCFTKEAQFTISWYIKNPDDEEPDKFEINVCKECLKELIEYLTKKRIKYNITPFK